MNAILASGSQGSMDAYYCKACARLEKDRDGCPKIINISSAFKDQFYERNKYAS
jgi:PHD finger-like domain-containing protein 5A